MAEPAKKLDANRHIACLIIGVTTFAFSWPGVFIGKNSGSWLEGKAESLGGIVLILMGFKILLW